MEMEESRIDFVKKIVSDLSTLGSSGGQKYLEILIFILCKR